MGPLLKSPYGALKTIRFHFQMDPRWDAHVTPSCAYMGPISIPCPIATSVLPLWLLSKETVSNPHHMQLRTTLLMSLGDAGGCLRDGGKCSTRKVFDTESVRQGNCSTISDVVRLGFVGQLPCRTISVSDVYDTEIFDNFGCR